MKTIPQNDLVRIFASYFGADMEILHHGINMRGVPPKVNGHWIHTIQHNPRFHVVSYKILLHSLSSITDEDAIEVAKIVYKPESEKEIEAYANVRNGKHALFKWNTASVKDCIEVIDFLRSSEWNGKKKRAYNIGFSKYSPADLVEAGVVKEI